MKTGTGTTGRIARLFGATDDPRSGSADPDTPRRARVADSVIFGVLGAAFATWAVRIPAVSGSLEIDSGAIGLALLGLAVGSILGLVTSSALVSRYGSRRVIRGGLFVYCLGLPVVGLAGEFASLVGLLVVFGFGKGLVDVAANAQGIRVERGYAGQIMGSFHGLFSGGGLVGSGFGGVAVVLGLSVETHFAIVGVALLLVGLAASTRLLPFEPSTGSDTAFALPSRKLAGFCAIGFCALFIEGVGNDWSAVFLDGPAGAGPAVATLGFAAFSLLMMVGRFLSDRLVTRLGARRFLRLTATVAGLGLALTLVAQPVVSLVGFAVLGAGLAGVMPVAVSMAGNHDPDTPAERAVAAVSTTGYGGFVIGPVLIGLLADATSLRTAFLPALGLAVAIVALTTVLPTVTRGSHTGSVGASGDD
ncbi:MFS transporter [Halococcus salsus]|uniref:MFS transporter n=1 Tax=Halococcus salsus TaxID=2162894 RepID=UPI00135B3EB9|nr:MFS transporter [Halococcus salsus]